MFKPITAFSGFSVSDLAATKAFYHETLGLEVKQDEMGLQLQVSGEATVFIYENENHQPATFTILNLVVANIDESITELAGFGVKFEQYHDENMPQDDKGVLRGLSAGMGPDIAWFKDPSGNIISILQDK
ncbi:MAG: VOC family protein [bacterium]|nr:VOC family protein [bacterium]